MPDPITPDTPPSIPDPRIADLERDLQSARDALTTAQRDHAIERALIRAGALDLAQATALVRSALAIDDPPDPERAVLDLRRTQPGLFTPPAPRATTPPHTDPPPELDHALDTARTTGDRRALLHYLRLKRA